MENHHVAASYAVLRESQNNFMEHLPRQVGSIPSITIPWTFRLFIDAPQLKMCIHTHK